MSRLLPWLWLGCWAVAFILTHIPITPRESGRVPHLDKVVHSTMYFAICYLGGLALFARGKATRRSLLAWACVYLAYAGLDELTQPLTGRQADLMDWFFDALGVVLATGWLSTARPPFVRSPRGGFPSEPGDRPM